MKRTIEHSVAGAILAIHSGTDITCTKDDYVKRVREAIRLYAAIHLDKDNTKDADIAFSYVRKLDQRFGLPVQQSFGSHGLTASMIAIGS